MLFDQIINKRQSIRKFSHKKISRKDLVKILKCGINAPSGKNRQPWHFYICPTHIKNTISSYMKNWHKHNANNKTSVLSTAITIDSAPTLILIFKKPDINQEKIDLLSIGASVENILLKATELNIASLWICATKYVENEIKQLLNLPFDLCSAIALGYADKTPQKPKKKPLNECIINKNFK